MSAVVASRIGRARQRYQDRFRLVSGCIPYKVIEYDDGNNSSERLHRVKVLMVSTPNRNDLVFPKGGWENDETVEEAACREALEEAGVKGNLRVVLGEWEFRSKSREEISCLEGGCRGYMFAMEVTEELEAWPEQGDKSRKWLNVEDARSMCRYDWMREALDKFSELIVKEFDKETINDGAVSPDDNLSTDPSDVVADCGVISLNCRPNPSTSHHSKSREFLGLSLLVCSEVSYTQQTRYSHVD